MSNLLDAYKTMTSSELAELGLTPAMKKPLMDAQDRGKKMVDFWNKTKAASSYADANKAWDNLSAKDRKSFETETGLGEREYIDLVRIKTQPPRNSKGDDLSGDAKQALATSAIMSDPTVEAFLMDIFKNVFAISV